MNVFDQILFYVNKSVQCYVRDSILCVEILLSKIEEN